MAASLAHSAVSNIDEEGPGFTGDVDMVKEEGAGGVDAAGGGISRVLCARDVSRVYRPLMISRKLDDASENVVGGLVGTAFLPPPFDDSAVVPIDDELFSLARESAKANKEELEANCFGPLDVSPLGLPAGDQVPCPPSWANRDCHTEARACVRVGSVLGKGLGSGDGGEDDGAVELELPPGQIIWGILGEGCEGGKDYR